MILGLAILQAGCSDNHPAVEAAVPTPSSSPAPVAKEEAAVVSGPLVVEHQVDLAAQRDGIVARIMVESGTRVKSGAILALLDDQQISADLQAANAKTRSIEADLKNWEAEAKVMEADYQRAQKMWDAALITKEQLDHAKFKAESEQWDVKRVGEMLTNARQTQRSLELELEKTRIRAPFDSLVARRYVRQGQQVVKGDRLFWVTAEAPLQMRFTLPEKFLGRLKRGEELHLTSPDAPEEKHTARIIGVSPVVDPSSGTVEVLVEVVGARGQLRPGMTVNVRIDNLR
ncbi:MAG: efflux RND transporter periplasmic adaptor subunit [Terriglobales bacterium]